MTAAGQNEARRLDDGRLIAETLAEDPAAARALLRRVGPTVLGTVRSVLRADDEVDDVVQDAFTALLRALPSFRAEATLEGFASSIAFRVAITCLRRRVRGRRFVPTAPEDLDQPGNEDAERAWRAHRLRVLLTGLPLAQAEAVVLRWLLGHSLPEIAAITGSPVATVRSRLRLARNALARQLGNAEGEG